MPVVSRPRRGTPPRLPPRDLPATLDGLVAVARAAFGADAAAVYLVDADSGDLRLAAAQGCPPEAMGHRLAPGEGLVGAVYAEGRSFVSADITVDPRAVRRRPDWDEPPWARGFLGVPLRAGPVIIGVLELTSHRADAFTPEERGRAAVFADAAALLVEQTRLSAQPPPAALSGASLEGEDPVAIATLDASLRITDANAAFTRLVGRPVEALVGRPILAILPALGRPMARDALGGALRGASTHLGRLTTDTEGDRHVVISLSLIPLGDPTRGIHGVMLAATDVSERARLEAELRAQNARALDARDRLRAVVEVVSHELRTPLTSVLGYARLLHDRPEADAARRAHWATLVIDKARLMARLVDEVTDLARLGSARMSLERIALDMAALARQVGADTTAQSGRHEVVVLEGEGVPRVWADAGRMTQVLTNLVGNAVKFWPDGGTITIAVASMPEGVRVDVEDRGPGVPAELAEHIFEPFYRAQSDATRDVPGTGLGLAVSRGIVEAHGGRLWHEAPPGGGARFSLVLPALGPEEG